MPSLSSVVWQLPPRRRALLMWRLAERRGEVTPRIVKALIRPGDTVLDIGAHRGEFTAPLGALVGASGRVHAFEPDPDGRLDLDSIKKALPQVEVHPIALSDGSGSAELCVPVVAGRRQGALSRVEPSRPEAPREEREAREALLGELVASRWRNRLEARRHGTAVLRYPIRLERLDAVIAVGERPIGFVKCDVEGHEDAVLRGAEALLRRWRPALLIEMEQRHRSGSLASTFEWLLALGYAGYFLTPGGLQHLAEFDVERHQTGPLARSSNGDLPADYVNDFFFAAPDTAVAELLA